MGYGRLVRFGSTESLPSITDQPITAPNRHRRYLCILLISAASLLVASAATTAVLLTHHSTTPSSLRKPTKAISRTCSLTRYPSLCINSLLDFPGAADAGESELVHISVNMTLRHVGVALYDAQPIANKDMDRLTRAAFEDCMELLDSSSAHLARALEAGTAGDDVVTWLSAAVTDHDTCEEGLEGVEEGNAIKKDMKLRLRNLSELVSNCLAIVSLSSKTENGNRRRLLGVEKGGFPAWVGEEERRLLQAAPGTIQADYVVSKNGVGAYKTIEEAVKAAPENSGRRIVIHVKAGTYFENIKVGRKKTNLMFIGDGKGLTVVAGSRSVFEKYTTFHTATFAATGTGFIARDMSFENTAGPAKHQAVALRIGADHAVVYRCNIIGYQDTLYVHSQRQFYRECDVYGTVDFIFGNAAVVFQACNLYARKPMPNQKNTITAQNRKDPNQNTGISIHACKILPAGDLRPVTGSYPTYLGRPWKMYSRVVYMLSYMSDHVHPSGWLEWSGDFALRSLYYGEYMNNGPGAAIGKRVSWPGFRVITLAEEAGKFTVGQFIAGATWLPSTGVAFLQGLRG